MTSLDQFPDVILLEILEKLDLVDVLSLRKTCRHLYNFIEDVCPEKNLVELKITTFSNEPVFQNAIKLEFGSPDSQKNTVEYQDFQETSCLVRWTKNSKIQKEKILDNPDFMDVASRDLQILLKHQKTKLTYLKMSFRSEINEKIFPRILESRPRPLQMENLDLEVTKQCQLLQILPFIDPGAVSYLRIERYENRDVVLKIDEVARLENWKKMKNSIHIGLNNGNIRDFLNFSDIYVKFPMVTLEDFVFLKEKFLHSSHINCVYLQVVTPIDLPELLEVFGPTENYINYMGSYRKRWFFKCYSNPDDILSIDFNPRCLQFQRS